MKVYAVIDTNVVVSSMLTDNQSSPTKYVLSSVRDGIIVPMINDDIIEEYKEVLSRDKFHFIQEDVASMLKMFRTRGEWNVPECVMRDFVDLNDVIFYETYLLRSDAYLVTGNLRHFPSEAHIVSPADMAYIIQISEGISDGFLNERVGTYMPESIQRAWEAVERMRASALANGIADMSMEEIDEEIRQYRNNKNRF